MNEAHAKRLVLALTALTAVLAGVLAIVGLNNATDTDIALPLAIAVSAGLIALGIALRAK